MLRLAHPVFTHEDVFLERYDRLLTAARALTAGDRNAALDLVHDAFLHFVLAQPRLDAIIDLDGYLFITVRNLHISQIRRASRTRQESLSLVDFDSAALSLRTLPAAHRFEVLDKLRWICEYALELRPPFYSTTSCATGRARSRRCCNRPASAFASCCMSRARMCIARWRIAPLEF
jgi:Sigma-70 region 2